MWLLNGIWSLMVVPTSVTSFACWIAPDIAWAVRKYRARYGHRIIPMRGINLAQEGDGTIV